MHDFFQKIYLFLIYKMLFPMVYQLLFFKKIKENLAIFCEVRNLTVGEDFSLLIEKYKNENYTVKTFCLGQTKTTRIHYVLNSLKFVFQMPLAKYVFISDACQVTSCVKKRKSTILTQVWHACGAFKKFGYSVSNHKFGVSENKLDKYPYYKNIDFITVSSEEVKWAYEEAMNSKKFGSKALALGVSRTDVFFQKEFKQKSKNILNENIPASKNKKILLYAPTFRGTVAKATSPNSLDFEKFKQAFKEEYILLIKNHPFVKKAENIPENCKDFAFDVSNLMNINNLICISDLCISDYSSLVFEYSLQLKPMVFYAPDLKDYEDWRGFYYDYSQMTPAPIFTENDDLIMYIKKILKDFNDEEIRNFKDKFMSSCDGNSTDRIFNFLKEKGKFTHEKKDS